MGPNNSIYSAFSSMTLEAGDDEKEGSVISAMTVNKGTKCLLKNTVCTAAVINTLTSSIAIDTRTTAISLHGSFISFISKHFVYCVIIPCVFYVLFRFCCVWRREGQHVVHSASGAFLMEQQKTCKSCETLKHNMRDDCIFYTVTLSKENCSHN